MIQQKHDPVRIDEIEMKETEVIRETEEIEEAEEIAEMEDTGGMCGQESIQRITIAEEEAGERLDRILDGRFSEFTRSYLQKLIRDGAVSVNGRLAKASARPACGDAVTVCLPEPAEAEILPEPIPLDILYEDDDILIVNKPKGMVVHPAPGHYSGTLVNALMYHCRDSLSGINGVLRPGIVHRIDRNTTGSLVVCKNDAAHRAIAAQLQEHSITRTYRAIVHGRLTEDGTVHTPIGRHPLRRKEMAVNVPNGRDAVTHYHILEQFDKFTYLECRLETGRTHQIRVHMKSIGHPVLGDDVYGPAKCPFPGLEGQTLHAMTIGFIHPSIGVYLEVSAPLPEYFEELLKKLRRA